MTRTGTALSWGFTALRFANHGGVGATAVANSSTGTPSLNITTTENNSALVVAVVDNNAIDGASRTWLTVNGITPTAGNGLELVYFRNAVKYAAYVAYYSDAGVAGVKTVGLSAPAGTKWIVAAVEIKGTFDPRKASFLPFFL